MLLGIGSDAWRLGDDGDVAFSAASLPEQIVGGSLDNQRRLASLELRSGFDACRKVPAALGIFRRLGHIEDRVAHAVLLDESLHRSNTARIVHANRDGGGL